MKVGIVGAGMIAHLCVNALNEVENVSAVAIWCLETEKESARELCAAGGFHKLYTDYGLFLKDSEIDVVYIGVINSLHYEYAKKALLAGKPVICEKPFTGTLAHAAELYGLADKMGLIIIEAVSFLYMPNFERFSELLKKLRGIKTVVCNYSQYSSRYDAYLAGKVLPAFNPMLSGGALYDINIYNLQLVAALFGRPESCAYYPNRGVNMADTSGVAVFDYDGFKAVCCGAKDSTGPCGATIQAANGYLHLEGAPNRFGSAQAVIDSEHFLIDENRFESHMAYEFEAFEKIFSNQAPELALKAREHTLCVMQMAQNCRDFAGIVFDEDRW